MGRAILTVEYFSIDSGIIIYYKFIMATQSKMLWMAMVVPQTIFPNIPNLNRAEGMKTEKSIISFVFFLNLKYGLFNMGECFSHSRGIEVCGFLNFLSQ